MRSAIQIILILFSLTGTVFAQQRYNNTLKLCGSSFWIKNRYSLSTPIDQVGVSYDRSIYKNVNVGAGYYLWKNWKRGGLNRDLNVSEPISSMPAVGALHTRSDYKMIDIAVLYRCVLASRHILKGGLAGSYCWGTNSYIDYYLLNLPFDAMIFYKYKKENYWGCVPQVSYDYLLLKGRIGAGLDLKARYYANRRPSQYDVGLHVGVNF